MQKENDHGGSGEVDESSPKKSGAEEVHNFFDGFLL
jgi:hypothetical protein